MLKLPVLPISEEAYQHAMGEVIGTVKRYRRERLDVVEINDRGQDVGGSSHPGMPTAGRVVSECFNLKNKRIIVIHKVVTPMQGSLFMSEDIELIKLLANLPGMPPLLDYVMICGNEVQSLRQLHPEIVEEDADPETDASAAVGRVHAALAEVLDALLLAPGSLQQAVPAFRLVYRAAMSGAPIMAAGLEKRVAFNPARGELAITKPLPNEDSETDPDRTVDVSVSITDHGVCVKALEGAVVIEHYQDEVQASIWSHDNGHDPIARAGLVWEPRKEFRSSGESTADCNGCKFEFVRRIEYGEVVGGEPYYRPNPRLYEVLVHSGTGRDSVSALAEEIFDLPWVPEIEESPAPVAAE